MDNWQINFSDCKGIGFPGSGGDSTLPHEYPMLVGLRHLDGSNFCGGTILSAYYILTAAHCVFEFKPGEFRIVAGDYDLQLNDQTEQVRIARHIIIHPGYDESTYENDIALLKLETPLFFGIAVEHIVLSREEVGEVPAVAVGWGKTSFISNRFPDQLLQMNVKIIGESACRRIYYYDRKIRTSMICAGSQNGTDTCTGDSGGPLLCDSGHSIYGYREQCGVISEGGECGNAGYPGVYTKVSHFIPWMIQHNAMCEKDSFMCHAGSRYGHCIPKRWRCNGWRDCYDGEDEDGRYCELLANCKPQLPGLGKCGKGTLNVWEWAQCIILPFVRFQ